MERKNQISRGSANSAERHVQQEGKKGSKHPTLLRITELEAQAIASCFRLYDYEVKGVISRHLAEKLIKSLGFTIPILKMNAEVSLDEILLILDQWSPNPEPALECSLATFSQLIGHLENDKIYISAQDLSDFFESIGKPPMSLTEINCLLTTLIEYDDCSLDPSVPLEVFTKQISTFARKKELDIGKGLVGSRIEIYWDGDDIYYPAKVVSFTEEQGCYTVLYDNDESNEQYSENLRESNWRIWDDSLFPVFDEEIAKREELRRECKIETEGVYAPALNSRTESKLSYSAMAVEAVNKLGEKNGSSLQSIRKYILQNFPLKAQQTASFNALTLKAVNKAVAQNELERFRNTFKLSANEKEKRRLKERRLCSDPKNPFSRREDDMLNKFTSLYGSILENNKSLRKTWEHSISKRDLFLEKHLSNILEFLPEKNYFVRRAKHLKLEEQMLGDQNAKIPTNQLSDIVAQNIIAVDNVGQNNLGLESTTLNSPEFENIDEDLANDDIKISSAQDGDVTFLSNFQTNRALKGVEILEKPPTLIADLHDYQVQGISWMVHMFKNGMPMILGDQMGLGKTLQSIGFLASLQHYLNLSGPHLIVVPLSVLSNWISEIERFCPTLRAVRFHGPKDERTRIKYEELNDIAEFDVVVTTFEMLVSEANFFRRKYMWTTVIVDEGHRLKNEKSQLSEKLRLVPTICKVILTGTPLQNNLRELWALFHFLAPEIFNQQSAELFDEGFDLLRKKIDANVLRRARKLLNVFMLRRLKDHVNIKLPSKKEITLLVSLTEKQTDWYKQLLCGLDKNLIEVVMKETSTNSDNTLIAAEENELIDSANLIPKKRGRSKLDSNSDIGINSKDNVDTSTASEWRRLMNLLLQLRKICNHVYLMPDGAPNPYSISEDIVAGSGKLLLLDRMLPRLREDNHRVLIFSQFTSMLDILEDYCELRQWQYVRLDGNTNRVQRRLDVRRFNAPNSSIFIFLISTRAGGLGLNLATADTVILYDSDWNPQVDIQAMERAHRIGQTKPVRIFRLVCRGSVEERMVSRADKKLFLNAMVAEADPDMEIVEDDGGDNADASNNDTEENQVSHALGVLGPAISKRELSSLIRFGANAIVDSSLDYGANQISDQDLDVLLERDGRDTHLDLLSVAISANGINVDDQSGKNESLNGLISESSQSQNVINKLEEVDLRQLGNVIYSKKKTSHSTKINEDILNFDFLDGKRKRVERITMVDGRGTGYGGNVPILNSNLEETSSNVKATNIHRRSREWTHQTFCCLCGKSKEMTGKLKCAHCPRVFHYSCLENHEFAWKGSGMFICPHHKCAGCGRSTASSGGLLFRCVSCLTSFCEDCLPQDEVESIGRSKDLEKIGYESKQSYYIKCPSCVVHSNGAQQVRLNEQTSDLNKTVEELNESNASFEDNVNANANEDLTIVNDEGPMYPSQLMRLYLEEVPETPVTKKTSRRPRGKTKRRSRSKQIIADADTAPKQDKRKYVSRMKEDFEDGESPEKKHRINSTHSDSQEGNAPLSIEDCLALLLSKAEELKSKVFDIINLSAITNSFSSKHCSLRSYHYDSIVNKIIHGRYRSETHFLNDMNQYLNHIEDDLNSARNKCDDDDDEKLCDCDEELDHISELQEYLRTELSSRIAIK